MAEKLHHAPQLIGGRYHIGQRITADELLTLYTGYNDTTNEVVQLFTIALPPTAQEAYIHSWLAAMALRQKIQSPHILYIHSCGYGNASIYIATDAARGILLQQTLDNHNIMLQRAIGITRQIAMGLKALHHNGITGLDLRPQLITIDTLGEQDHVQINDIGLRSLLTTLGYSSNRQESLSYLDPRYTPPEYTGVASATAQSDIYQLGLLLFTIITGRLPFVGRDPEETRNLQRTAPVPDMAQYAHDTPQDIQAIVECAMEKDPAKRFANIDAFLSALNLIRLPSPAAANTVIEAETADVLPHVQLTAETSSIDVALLSTQIETSPLTQTTQLLAEEGVYAYLLYETSGEPTQRIPLTASTAIIGRTDPKRGLAPDIDLSPFDPKMTISRLHARIYFAETFCYIEDLKSRNKTRLKGQVLPPFQSELLQHGDVLHFGHVRMRFMLPGEQHTPLQEGTK